MLSFLCFGGNFLNFVSVSELGFYVLHSVNLAICVHVPPLIFVCLFWFWFFVLKFFFFAKILSKLSFCRYLTMPYCFKKIKTDFNEVIRRGFLTEQNVGITEFVGKQKPFVGIVKHRYILSI